MRHITEHIANPTNDRITITVADEPGQGGANHHYHVDWLPVDGGINVAIPNYVDIKFQNGPIKEFGVNGVTQEVLLAIVIDRLRGFQSGEFKCRENAIALTHIEEALMWLQKRTRDRLARGVEGTNQK